MTKEDYKNLTKQLIEVFNNYALYTDQFFADHQNKPMTKETLETCKRLKNLLHTIEKKLNDATFEEFKN